MGAREKEIRKEMTSFYRSSVEIFRQIIEDGISIGEFENIDAERIARLIYFLSHGVFSTFFAVDCDFDLIKQHTFNMETLLKSIRKS
jgi:hypothetical protein